MQPYRNTEIDDWRAEERYRTAWNALTNHPEKLSAGFAEEYWPVSTLYVPI
jgi:hypothetical protein